MRYSVPRKARRVPLGGDVHLKLENIPEPVAARILNISLGGMSVALEQPAELGSLVAFEMDVAETLVEGTGEVVWVRSADEGEDRPIGMGVRFRYLSPGSRERIFRLVQWFARHEGAVSGQQAAGDLPPIPHRPGGQPPAIDPLEDPLAALGPVRANEVPTARLELPPGGVLESPVGSAPAPSLAWDSSLLDPVAREAPEPTVERPSEPSEPGLPEAPPAPKREPAGIPVGPDLFSAHREPPADHRRRALAVVLGVVLLAAAVVLVPRWLRRDTRPPDGPEAAEKTVGGAPAGASVPAAKVAAPADQAPATAGPSDPAATTAAPVDESTVPPQASAAAQPATAEVAKSEPEPSKAPSANLPAQPLRATPATLLRRISHQRSQDGTEVSLLTDGDVTTGAYSISRLDGPNPRIVIRLKGIRATEVKPSLAIGSPELSRIRVGLHGGGSNGAEAHIVLDLASRAVTAGEAEAIPGGLRIVLRRR